MSAQEAGMINRCKWTVSWNNSKENQTLVPPYSGDFRVLRSKANKMEMMTSVLPEAYVSVYRVAVAT